uniref:Uncharacterized protein n=1 Tax=Anguilla anguilla TaxID=7936 RepID=A0A0E9RB10_ANGAN
MIQVPGLIPTNW